MDDFYAEYHTQNFVANTDDGSCEFADGAFFVTCDGGGWQSETSWDLINENSNLLRVMSQVNSHQGRLALIWDFVATFAHLLR